MDFPEIILTRKKKPCLILNGYQYRIHRQNKEVTSWICLKSKMMKCKGMVKTNPQNVVLSKADHSCAPNIVEIELKKTMQNCRKRVREEMSVPVHKIFREEMAKFYAKGYELNEKMPVYSSAKTALCLERRKLLGSQGKQNIELSDELTSLNSSNKMLISQKKNNVDDQCATTNNNMDDQCIRVEKEVNVDCAIVKNEVDDQRTVVNNVDDHCTVVNNVGDKCAVGIPQNISQDEDDHDVIKRRIVDIDYFLNELKELNKHGPLGCGLSEMQVISERTYGLVSELKMKCSTCSFTKIITTENRKSKGDNSNAAAVEGFMKIGCGYSNMEEFLSTLNTPLIPVNTFLKEQRIILEAWEATASSVDSDPESS